MECLKLAHKQFQASLKDMSMPNADYTTTARCPTISLVEYRTLASKF